MDDTRELADTINAFPTANRPLSDTTLKDMLISLRSSLHSDMMYCMRNFKAEVGELGGRIDHMEKKMEEYASSYYSLVDFHNDQSDEVAWLKDKVADLEDRSCRNNIKLRGVPESVLPAQLHRLAQELMGSSLPSTPESE